MHNGPKSDVEPWLATINLRLLKTPDNPVLIKIKKALNYEKLGNNAKALALYQQCKDDPFAQESMVRVAPLKMVTSAPIDTTCSPSLDSSPPPEKKPQLTDLLSEENYRVFLSIQNFKERQRTLTQEGLVNATHFSKHKIIQAIGRLQRNGYIIKNATIYADFKILKIPVVVEGQIGVYPQNTPSVMAQVPTIPLLFSMQHRTLSKEKAGDVQNVNLLRKSNSQLKLA